MNIPLNSFKLSFTVTWFTIKSLWRLICSSWAQVDSNHRPRAYQARALTSWAMSPYAWCVLIHLSPLWPSPVWWRWWDSNPWPPACRAGALPTELHPRLRFPLTGCWRRPIFPSRLQRSIFGTAQLNFRVRNGNGWTLCVNGTNCLSLGHWKLNNKFTRFKRSADLSSPSQAPTFSP